MEALESDPSVIYVLSYILSNVACIFILLMILYRSGKGINLPRNFMALKRVIMTVIAFFVSDMIWLVVMANGAETPYLLKYLSSTANSIIITLAGYYWFCFCLSMVHEDGILREQNRYRIQLPILIACLGYVCFYWTGFDLSTVEEITGYGLVYMALYTIPVCYVLYASWRALLYALAHYEERELYLSVAFFAVSPLVTAFLQLRFWALPLNCFVMTSCIVFTYLLLLESLISRDTLTQISTRGEVMHKLAEKLDFPPHDNMIFILMMDLDDFKHINDTYGHPEGDHALQIFAEALKLMVHRWSYPLSVGRYGGDEFLVVGECRSETELASCKLGIRAALMELVNLRSIPYDLQVSIGSAALLPGQHLAMAKFMELADHSLYNDKRQRKIERRSLNVR